MIIHELILLLAVTGLQDTKDRAKLDDDDDEVVAGLPVGEGRPLPERVKWDIAAAIDAKTSKRERIDLSGFWRFAAVDEQQAAVKREEMGWIELPGLPAADGANVFDARFRDSDGIWRGKPIEKYPFVWIERDIHVSNSDALEWLNRRIFLVLAGPWADAEIYTSQRLVKRQTNQTDNNDSIHVHVEPVTGIERDGVRWCEITEQLIYPGITQISIRLKQQANPAVAGDDAPEPNIAMERLPTGCRIDSTQLHRNTDSSSIKATFNLERPATYMILGMPPVRTLPLSIKVRIESAEGNKELASITKDVGPLADPKRTVSLDIPWSFDKGDSGGERMRMHVQLMTAKDVLFDEPFPIEFRPGELAVAEQ